MTIFDPLMLQENVIATWEKQGADPSNCLLYWRRHQLLVRRSLPQPVILTNRQKPPYLPPLSDPQWLVECLRRSPVRLVRGDVNLEERSLRAWADACVRSNKTLYLRLPTAAQLPQRRTGTRWRFKRVCDWTLAALALGLLSPIFVGIAIAVTLTSPGPIFFAQWRVGERGKLFRILKFRTMMTDAEKYHHQVMAGQASDCLHKREDDPRITPLGRWLRRYSLDELPQLINVLRGEMSLVGPRPWALYDAVRIRPELRSRLNALPGITGAWQVEARSHLVDLDAVNDRDLEYLRNWSLVGDLRILLRTVPKVLSGFGAY